MNKILLIEDDRVTFLVTRKLLEDNGYQVVGTREGGQAVSLALAEKPDLILLDLGLESDDPFSSGQFDGFMIMEWLQRMNTETAIPILVITARKGEAVRRQVLEAGAVGFFQKPVEPESLLAAIRTTLEASQGLPPS